MFLSPHAAVFTPGPRSLRVPTASRSALAFAQVVGARRVARSQPGSSLVPDSPSNTCRGLSFTELQRSLDVTACGFGRPHRLGRTPGGVNASHPCGPSGEPCRGKFRRGVTTATRPLPIQPSGRLLNQTPFILEETNFDPRTRLWDQALKTRNYIVRANLRLVVSIARR